MLFVQIFVLQHVPLILLYAIFKAKIVKVLHQINIASYRQIFHLCANKSVIDKILNND